MMHGQANIKIVQAAKLFIVVISICTALSWNLLNAILLAPRILKAAPKFLENLPLS